MTDQLQTTHTELKNSVAGLDYSYNRVMAGTKSAHTAYRNQLQQIKKLCDQLRKLTLANQKTLPTRKKKKAAELAELTRGAQPEVDAEQDVDATIPVDGAGIGEESGSDGVGEPEPVVKTRKKRGKKKN